MEHGIPLLLVEDEPYLREALGEYLEASGFAVTAVSTAAEALASPLPVQPRILLTDLRLPDRRGDSFLQEFHTNHPACLLYVHSGDSSYQPSEDLVACGLTPDHVFFKPADLAKLAAKLRADAS